MDIEEPRVASRIEPWPALPWEAWRDTCDTLHLWTQIVGKVVLARRPFLNEWWQVALHLGPRGLTTGAIPADGRFFGIDFDFLDHQLVISTSEGARRFQPLRPRTVADFYRAVRIDLRELGVDTPITTMPSEIPGGVAFDVDTVHRSYDPAPVSRWWQILLQSAAVLERWRSPFVGKSSPVHFFWGSFDLNTARFSGRPAAPPPGPCYLRLSEDQENFACGFWPGNTAASGITLGQPAYYAYMYPSPPGFDAVQLRTPGALYHRELGQHLLPYDTARRAKDPAALVHDFFQEAWESAAELAGLDRSKLERWVDCRDGR